MEFKPIQHSPQVVSIIDGNTRLGISTFRATIEKATMSCVILVGVQNDDRFANGLTGSLPHFLSGFVGDCTVPAMAEQTSILHKTD